MPTSKRGLCPRCEEVVTVIEYLVTQEKEEAERVARRKATGLVLPDEIWKGRARKPIAPPFNAPNLGLQGQR